MCPPLLASPPWTEDSVSFLAEIYKSLNEKECKTQRHMVVFANLMGVCYFLYES